MIGMKGIINDVLLINIIGLVSYGSEIGIAEITRMGF